MATFYSSFFSSGLLAVDADGVHRPDQTTPRAFNRTFVDDMTPTASSFSAPTVPAASDVIPSLLAQTEAITISADRPRVRRRRSSVGLSSSPVAPLKAAPPLPRAAVHLQRQSMPTGMMSPNRSRSGSISDFHRSAMGMTSMASSDATNSTNLMGRLRSGSVGNSLRSVSRRVRKPAAANAPAPPPPTAPLPAPPTLCLPPGGADLATLPRAPRRPLSRRVQTADGAPVVLHTPSIAIPKRGSTMEDSLPSSPLVSSFNGEGGYPTPLETPGEVRGEYFA
ncbi:hypothetical protein PHLGIDRAFT_123873 [Phlebiopsis gigantea 11061_1 CR5-6]|uniref:Uncharacterized protein n=1 Tax=Phlebiopsis gigantea (strain 11061_1 CR5-6) TaxID=745531 RepID=A0A0C3P4A8_PHLG1|nr:hypothetical protein PHLGIDRAFT_123873 [Phlebiopsis gigantea 11061_1 CR5-6]